MNEAEVLSALEEHDAVRHGHFKLSSGAHSDMYVQCALVLQWPGIAERLGHELGTRLAPLAPTVVIGPAMGGIVIGHEVARFLGVRMLFTERVAGAMSLRRGFQLSPQDRVAVVEDVVTTGSSPREVVELVRAQGGDPVGVATIVDRSDHASFGVPFEALCRIHAGRWDTSSCPLCAGGEPLTAPGSRHLG